MKIRIILLFVAGLIIFGCNTDSNKNITVQKDSLVTEEHQHHEETESIMLDNGKKWVIVPEMMKYLRNIESGVNDFSKKENPVLDDYKNLSLLIQKNLDSLTSNCTMTGQAHDELHKWLVPFLDLSKEFSESKNQEDAKINFQKVKSLFCNTVLKPILI